MNFSKMLRVMLSITFIFFAVAAAHAQNSFDELMNAGIEFHDAGKYDEAIQQFETALKKDPQNTFAHYEMANTYIRLKKYDKAIKHADKVIDANDKNLGGAYILKGTAYDLLEKPKKAIDVYKKGIKAVPDLYLLFYNLAVTQAGIKEYDNAEVALTKALARKPNHSSSHYALGVIHWEKGSKVKTLLALYNFIILESNTARAANALKIIDAVINQTAKKKEKENGFDMTITLSSNSGNDGFGAADMMFGLSRALIMGENKEKLDSLGFKSSPALDGFIQTNESLFKYLGEVKESKDDFLWNFYATFFGDMEKAGFTEVLSYYVRMPAKSAEVKKWMSANQEMLKKWNAWMKEYERKF